MKRFIKKLGTLFLAGLLVLVPIGLIILVLVWLFNWIDGILGPLILNIWGVYYTGIGFGVIIILIFIAGLIVSNFLGKKILAGIETYFFHKIPVVGYFYKAIKQVIGSFSKTTKNGYLKVVFVEFPRKGMRSIGFVTNERVSQTGEKEYNVFVPTSPNPTTGFLLILREEEIITSELSVNDAIKLVVSAGKYTPDDDCRVNNIEKHKS